jgi:mitogen-activated protein kinase kinase kinase 7
MVDAHQTKKHRASMRLAACAVALAAIPTMAQGDTINLRSVEETAPSSLPSDDSFEFDGTNSDIAQQLYVRHRAGDTDSSVTLSSVPIAVTDRLDPLGIAFNDLPGLVQRALLWDTGFAISPTDDPVQIWTMEGYTMADIAVPKGHVEDSGCTFKNCSQPNDVTAYYTLICSGVQMLNVSRCVADTFVDSAAASYMGSMWSNGGDPAMAPQIRLRDHSWDDPVTKVSSSVYAVHTVSNADDPAWNVCPADDSYAALTIPCHRRDEFTDAEMAAMTAPSGSAWVTTWLQEEFADSPSFDLLLLVPIVLSSGVFIAVVVYVWSRWKRSGQSKMEDKTSSTCELDGSSPNYVGEATASLPKYASGTPQTHRPTVLASQHSAFGSSFCGDFGHYESAGSCKTLQILLGSDHLRGKRIPYESLAFQSTLSKGSSGEVWLCEYTGQQLAAKRLLQSKEQKAKSVQAFAAEIELSASLVHPHVVEFVGVAWNTLNNLVMLLEYVPTGSLQDYLHQNADLLSWASEKVRVAVGIAHALEYLHARKTPIIHRDLKSNNVLLTSELEPKLIDFGVSRDCSDLTMTAAVGTPYWTAPEVLEGDRYTEQADVYSFGVVLTELDTGRIPYFDAVTQGGSKMKPVQILQDVVAGTLHPNFAEDCPRRIRRIGLACLAHDPSSRPTVRQLVRELEGSSGKRDSL